MAEIKPKKSLNPRMGRCLRTVNELPIKNTLSGLSMEYGVELGRKDGMFPIKTPSFIHYAPAAFKAEMIYSTYIRTHV